MRPASITRLSILAVMLLVLTSLVSPSNADPIRTTGLKQGDVAFYSLSGTYGFSPAEPVTKMTVSSVSTDRTNVTVSFFDFFPDNSLPPIWIDTYTGERYNSSTTFFFAVGSGLASGDGIYNTWTNVTIVAQGVSNCGGTTRATIGAQFLDFGTGQTIRIAWDQLTGTLCGYDARDQSGRVLTLSMINNTIWGQPARPGQADPFTVGAEISAITGLPLVAIVVFVYSRRRRATKTKTPE